MIPGAMQPYSLTVDKFLDHAAKWHSRSQVVTATGAGDSTRTDYLALRAQAQRVSAALAERGAGQGDVVATLAWNTQEHLESWYGIMGMGAICHTLNPRLLPTQLAAMLGESGARLLILSADLQPLASDVLALGTAIKEVLLIDNGLSAGQIAGDTFKAGTLADATRQATREVEWMGHRPATSDSLPLIGEIGKTGVFAGLGHHHIGLTAGPKTGRLLAGLITQRPSNADLTPYQPGRFS